MLPKLWILSHLIVLKCIFHIILSVIAVFWKVPTPICMVIVQNVSQQYTSFNTPSASCKMKNFIALRLVKVRNVKLDKYGVKIYRFHEAHPVGYNHNRSEDNHQHLQWTCQNHVRDIPHHVFVQLSPEIILKLKIAFEMRAADKASLVKPRVHHGTSG